MNQNEALGFEVAGDKGLDDLRAEAAHCRACPLWEHATQTVFGEGSATARLVLIGEQPGDQEDLQGHPFVGPAGKLLNASLEESGISRSDVYITNAVKHFKWIASGERRLHQKPNRREVLACEHWLRAELAAIQPKVIVALGATAAQALLGSEFRLTAHRGEFQSSPIGTPVLATLHPAAILRNQDPSARESERLSLVADLKIAFQCAESEVNPRYSAGLF